MTFHLDLYPSLFSVKCEEEAVFRGATVHTMYFPVLGGYLKMYSSNGEEINPERGRHGTLRASGSNSRQQDDSAFAGVEGRWRINGAEREVAEEMGSLIDYGVIEHLYKIEDIIKCKKEKKGN